MKATDLVKSLSLSSIASEDFKVVTLYKDQDLDVFLVDNFGDGNVVNAKPFSLEPPTLLGSKDFLHVEVLRKIKEISSEEVDRVLKEIFTGV